MSDEKANVAVNSIELATELTIAWLNNPNVTPSSEDALSFLRSMRGEIEGMANPLETSAADAAPEYVPAVSIRSSVKPDHIVSLIDGKKYKSLKRHLSSRGLTPAEYRQRYGLKPDYPMVAAEYSAARREVAVKLGLGQKNRASRGKAALQPATAPESVVAPAKPGRASAKTKAVAAAPRATRAAKAEKVAAPAQVKPVRAAKPAADKAAAPKRGWWKKSDTAGAEAAPAKRGRPKKASAEV
ncbi:MucR family transcriptional regulator [Sphingomonas lycopersici]|uniref:MucR family transcriptional regulator n=1 Tax=Sphingomonas lycopersici TaxID=2951807 RepID=A0AA41ZHT8_9SPHN|nr:MucR family transcriptional regulator [Sphingomonas lycopersici]MCW6535948.1 MucR family transcriptional regulator [Sphingomonas lycopersici]